MAVKIFFCYAHEDEPLLNKLKTRLRPLLRQGLINVWHDRDIRAGTEWEQAIKEQLNTAQIILLLVSPDFMDSDYVYDIEMKRAIERHEHGEARVIPIILDYVHWQETSLGKLQALPTDGKPIMGADWHSPNQAFLDVVVGIHKIVEELTPELPTSLPITPIRQAKLDLKPEDIVAIVEEARKLEEQFQANDYTGRSNVPHILEVKGTLPVVLSAPHAVRCGREAQKQVAQLYTGALALQLARLTGASALVSARTSDEDPNRGETGLYKQRMSPVRLLFIRVKNYKHQQCS